MTCHIREATPEDSALLLHFIRELAEYEKLLHEVVTDEETLAKSLFGPAARTHAIIAEIDGTSVGFSIFFYNFSTFLGRRGIYIEDLFVKPEYRGKGIGKALLKYLAAKALKEECGRLEWAVLDWNEPSINFYKSLGARPMEEWIVYRLTGDSMKKLSAS
jgi:GNAT superfamily N-acetyltransferase